MAAVRVFCHMFFTLCKILYINKHCGRVKFVAQNLNNTFCHLVFNYSLTKRNSYKKYECVITDCPSTIVYVVHRLWIVQTLTFVMLSYKYCINKVALTVSKHTATILSCNLINITLT